MIQIYAKLLQAIFKLSYLQAKEQNYCNYILKNTLVTY